jgi:hypothetical protein
MNRKGLIEELAARTCSSIRSAGASVVVDNDDPERPRIVRSDEP